MSSNQNSYGATFKHSPAFYILSRLVVLFFMIIIIFPILYTFSMSIRSPETVYSAKFFLIPEEFSFQNYIDAFEYGEKRLKVSFPRMFVNSIIVTSSSVILIITLSIFAAFGFSHYKFPLKRICLQYNDCKCGNASSSIVNSNVLYSFVHGNFKYLSSCDSCICWISYSNWNLNFKNVF